MAGIGGRRQKKARARDGHGRARGEGIETFLKIKEHEKRMLSWQWWCICVDALGMRWQPSSLGAGRRPLSMALQLSQDKTNNGQ